MSRIWIWSERVCVEEIRKPPCLTKRYGHGSDHPLHDRGNGIVNRCE